MGAFAVDQSRDDIAKSGEREVDLCCLLYNVHIMGGEFSDGLRMEKLTFNLCPLAPVLLWRSLQELHVKSGRTLNTHHFVDWCDGGNTSDDEAI